MIEINIAGHANGTLLGLLKKRPNELDAIIITNSVSVLPEWIAPLVKSSLHLKFDDAIFTMGKDVLVTKEILQKALDFAKNKEKLVVACHQGVSRSSALAYLIACQAWGSTKALTIFKEIHDPNSLVIKLGAELMDKEVYKQFAIWTNTRSRGYSDIYDISDVRQAQELIQL